jgi:hypothetical protein
MIPVIAEKHGVSSRAAFATTLERVKGVIADGGVTEQTAKATMSACEALKAWATFDTRLSKAEKQEANRVFLRCIIAIAALADSLPPVNGHTQALRWMMQILGINHSRAAAFRKITGEPAAEWRAKALEQGLTWSSYLKRRSARQESVMAALSSFTRKAKESNTVRLALTLRENRQEPSALKSVRAARAWLEALEHAIVSNKATDAEKQATYRKRKLAEVCQP